jgi:metallophosphoesterase superfamily enzyme
MASMKERARAPRALLGGTSVRVIIPDSHGNHIDIAARDACLRDIKALNPTEVILLGDHLDAGGTFNSHQRTYTNEMAESYADDCFATNEFLDLLQEAAPSAKAWDYLEGNHEQHVERWAARNFHNQKDAEALLEVFGPEKVLNLKRRHIKYYKRSIQYDEVSIPGCIRRGKCHFVHGISHSKHAAATHLARFGASVVFGHIHRSQSVVERSVTSNGYGAWCPGTLAKLQPLYKHTEPSSWSHGYGVQFVNPSGNFIHVNVPILNGESMLAELLRAA